MSKKHPAQKGEIATILTFATLGILVLATVAGSANLTSVKKLFSKAQEASPVALTCTTPPASGGCKARIDEFKVQRSQNSFRGTDYVFSGTLCFEETLPAASTYSIEFSAAGRSLGKVQGLISSSAQGRCSGRRIAFSNILRDYSAACPTVTVKAAASKRQDGVVTAYQESTYSVSGSQICSVPTAVPTFSPPAGVPTAAATSCGVSCSPASGGSPSRLGNPNILASCPEGLSCLPVPCTGTCPTAQYRCLNPACPTAGTYNSQTCACSVTPIALTPIALPSRPTQLLPTDTPPSSCTYSFTYKVKDADTGAVLNVSDFADKSAWFVVNDFEEKESFTGLTAQISRTIPNLRFRCNPGSSTKPELCSPTAKYFQGDFARVTLIHDDSVSVERGTITQCGDKNNRVEFLCAGPSDIKGKDSASLGGIPVDCNREVVVEWQVKRKPVGSYRFKVNLSQGGDLSRNIPFNIRDLGPDDNARNFKGTLTLTSTTANTAKTVPLTATNGIIDQTIQNLPVGNYRVSYSLPSGLVKVKTPELDNSKCFYDKNGVKQCKDWLTADAYKLDTTVLPSQHNVTITQGNTYIDTPVYNITDNVKTVETQATCEACGGGRLGLITDPSWSDYKLVCAPTTKGNKTPADFQCNANQQAGCNPGTEYLRNCGETVKAGTGTTTCPADQRPRFVCNDNRYFDFKGCVIPPENNRCTAPTPTRPQQEPVKPTPILPPGCGLSNKLTGNSTEGEPTPPAQCPLGFIGGNINIINPKNIDLADSIVKILINTPKDEYFKNGPFEIIIKNVKSGNNPYRSYHYYLRGLNPSPIQIEPKQIYFIYEAGWQPSLDKYSEIPIIDNKNSNKSIVAPINDLNFTLDLSKFISREQVLKYRVSVDHAPPLSKLYVGLRIDPDKIRVLSSPVHGHESRWIGNLEINKDNLLEYNASTIESNRSQETLFDINYAKLKDYGGYAINFDSNTVRFTEKNGQKIPDDTWDYWRDEEGIIFSVKPPRYDLDPDEPERGANRCRLGETGSECDVEYLRFFFDKYKNIVEPIYKSNGKSYERFLRDASRICAIESGNGYSKGDEPWEQKYSCRTKSDAHEDSFGLFHINALAHCFNSKKEPCLIDRYPADTCQMNDQAAYDTFVKDMIDTEKHIKKIIDIFKSQKSWNAWSAARACNIKP